MFLCTADDARNHTYSDEQEGSIISSLISQLRYASHVYQP